MIKHFPVILISARDVLVPFIKRHCRFDSACCSQTLRGSVRREFAERAGYRVRALSRHKTLNNGFQLVTTRRVSEQFRFDDLLATSSVSIRRCTWMDTQDLSRCGANILQELRRACALETTTATL
jgi:hypothetical protein